MARVTRRPNDKKGRGVLSDDAGRNLTTVAAPVPLPYKASEFVRLKHPHDPGTYYSTTTASWVTEGWTVWKIDEWKKRFPGADKDDLRQWEFFGYSIPLYNDGDPNA